ncbi:MAG TPA: 50S ribosomal protein L11 methyltransferase [Anaerolineae bacterium]|nr:50S ribosomal protein L11 methyltransferase [Anaerolineae bacterium]HIQ06155.1 50S ribosomal protein L11 methyltransferase [Anaerolineae bacterium]
MNWLEISVQADNEAAEAVSEVFNRYNSGAGGGAVIETTGFGPVGEADATSVTVRTYLPDDPTGRLTIERIQEALWYLSRLYPIPEPVVRSIPEENWANAWKRHYQPFRVGRHLLIVPSWQSVQPERGDVVITLDPGMAFGTGLHPTTRLSLAALERYLQVGDRVLDVGTGSGILAIAAAKLGARQVLGTDTDPVAVAVARENAAYNGVGNTVQVLEGSLPPEPTSSESGDDQRWEVIVVNILAHVIVALLREGLDKRLAASGRLILSGIISPRLAEVTDELTVHQLQVLEQSSQGDWVTLVATTR